MLSRKAEGKDVERKLFRHPLKISLPPPGRNPETAPAILYCGTHSPTYSRLCIDSKRGFNSNLREGLIFREIFENKLIGYIFSKICWYMSNVHTYILHIDKYYIIWNCLQSGYILHWRSPPFWTYSIAMSERDRGEMQFTIDTITISYITTTFFWRMDSILGSVYLSFYQYLIVNHIYLLNNIY